MEMVEGVRMGMDEALLAKLVLTVPRILGRAWHTESGWCFDPVLLHPS